MLMSGNKTLDDVQKIFNEKKLMQSMDENAYQLNQLRDFNIQLILYSDMDKKF